MLEPHGRQLPCKPRTLERSWGTIAQAPVGTFLIIQPTRGLEHHPGLRHGRNARHLQTCVAHGPVDALPVALVPGTAGLDVYRRHLVLRQPPADCQRDDLWPVSAPD